MALVGLRTLFICVLHLLPWAWPSRPAFHFTPHDASHSPIHFSSSPTPVSLSPYTRCPLPPPPPQHPCQYHFKGRVQLVHGIFSNNRTPAPTITYCLQAGT